MKQHSELPPSPLSQAGVLNNLTGSWRYLRPQYEEKLAPCIAACPAGERVEAWIRLIEDEKYFEAWQLIKSVNPFPRVCGRVCFHPCETDCNRGSFDRAIAIHSLERFVSEEARSLKKTRRPRIRKTGRRVGIVGSGPAGLTCAYHLALRGHTTTVFEAETEPGGLLRYGIPSYRLPKDVLAEEIGDIIRLGIEVQTGERIQDLKKARKEYDALFVATGLGKSVKMDIPGEQNDGVHSAIEFLRLVNSGATPEIGAKTIVVGGGNAAIDSARTARRLGAEVTILYRRSRDEMPAYPPEVEEAEKEGVTIQFLTQPIELVRQNEGVLLVACIRNQLGEADESGRRKPVPVKGSNFVMEVNTVIVAVGERSDDSLVTPDSLQKQSKGKSRRKLPEGVFVGGDLASAQRTVAHAIGSGRKAAMLIDKYLGGSGKDPANYLHGEIVNFENLNLDYFPHKTRIRLPMLPLRERERTFEEISLSIGAEAAADEAERCFHCGVCISCDNCFVYCPDIAVKKAENGIYTIDYDYCKGCGICVHECPRNAMSIHEEIRK